MRKTITFILCTLMMFGFVSAQDLQRDAGITPDSPLYGLDRAMEELRYRFTSTFFSDEDKVNYGILIAEERLAEIQELQLRSSVEIGENEIEENLFDGINLAEQERQRILIRLEIDSEKLNTEARQRIQERLQLHISNEEKIREGLQTMLQDKIGDNKIRLDRIKKQGGKQWNLISEKLQQSLQVV